MLLEKVQKMMPVISRTLQVCVAVVALSSCGSNNDAIPSPPSSLAFRGTVAVGSPVANASVSTSCANGTSGAALTDSGGNYSIRVMDAALPCVFRTNTGAGTLLRSFADNEGIVNITPLTELTFQLAGGNVSGKPSAVLALEKSLPSFGIPVSGDPVTTPFVANGTGHDAALDRLGWLINTNKIQSDSLSEFLSKWAGQCPDQTLCAPIELAIPEAPANISKEDKTSWGRSLILAEKLASFSKKKLRSSAVGSLAIELYNTYWTEGASNLFDSNGEHVKLYEAYYLSGLM